MLCRRSRAPWNASGHDNPFETTHARMPDEDAGEFAIYMSRYVTGLATELVHPYSYTRWCT